MIDGPSLVAELTRCGVTHMVWIPDTELGTWEPALSAAADLRLLRVCREGEAFALAAGLHLGGAKPIVVIQCTGMFEAGDAMRNVIHDMKLPIFFIVGVRSYYLHQQNATADTCPIYAEPILSAWQIPYEVLDQRNTAEDIGRAYRQTQTEQQARAVLIAE